MMKAILFLSILVGCTFFAKAQEKPVEKAITLDIPQGAENPSAQALSTYLRNRKNTQVIKPALFNGLTYKYGDIIVQINADTGNFSTDRLELYKKNEDNLMANAEGIDYSSELTTINQNRVVIIKTQRKDFNYYRFMSINGENNKIVFGTLEFVKADEDKLSEF